MMKSWGVESGRLGNTRSEVRIPHFIQLHVWAVSVVSTTTILTESHSPEAEVFKASLKHLSTTAL